MENKKIVLLNKLRYIERTVDQVIVLIVLNANKYQKEFLYKSFEIKKKLVLLKSYIKQFNKQMRYKKVEVGFEPTYNTLYLLSKQAL